MYDLHKPASDPMVDLGVHGRQMHPRRPLAVRIALVLVPRQDMVHDKNRDVCVEDPALVLAVADPVDVDVTLVVVSELLVRISISIMCVFDFVVED